MRRIWSIAILLFLSIVDISFAKEVRCDMRIDKDRISPGKQAQIEIELPHIFGQTAPELPIIGGIDIQFSRLYSKPAGESGAAAPNLVFVYKVVPRKEGIFLIGPFIFQRGGDTYRTNHLTLTVEKEEIRAVMTQRPQAADLKDRIYLVMEVPKTTVFVNEKVPAILKLYTDWIDLENINFSQKQSEYLLVKNFKDKTVNIIDEDSARFAVLKYTSSFYAVTAGTYMLESVAAKFNVAMPRRDDKDGKMPDLLNDNMPFYESFIGEAYSRPMELESQPVEIKVLPLPTQARPASFRGAVGKFVLDLKSDKQVLRPDEQARLTVTISGEGNFDALGEPIVNDMTGLGVSAPKMTRLADSTVYDISLTVQSADVSILPNILFSYFDPEKKNYFTLSRAIPIKVETSRKPETQPLKIRSSKDLQRDQRAPDIEILPIKMTIGRFYRPFSAPYRNTGFWIFLLLPMALVSYAMIFDRRRSYMKSHPDYAALVRASRMAERSIKHASRYLRLKDADSFYKQIFKMMQEYVGERSFTPCGGVTGRTVDEYFEPYVGRETADRIKQIFSECYSARYASGESKHAAMDSMLKEAAEIIVLLNKEPLQKSEILSLRRREVPEAISK